MSTKNHASRLLDMAEYANHSVMQDAMREAAKYIRHLERKVNELKGSGCDAQSPDCYYHALAEGLPICDACTDSINRKLQPRKCSAAC